MEAIKPTKDELKEKLTKKQNQLKQANQELDENAQERKRMTSLKECLEEDIDELQVQLQNIE